ncbi:MAG: class I SAM-dependent methyltransferase [Chloroflexota bacterium]
MIEAIQPHTARIATMMRTFIQRQQSVNSNVTLEQFKDGDCPPYFIDPRLVTFAASERRTIAALLRAEVQNAHNNGQQNLLHVFTMPTEEYIYRNNQFIALSEIDRQEIVEVYVKFLTDLADMLSLAENPEEIKTALFAAQKQHLLRLRRFVMSLAERNGRHGKSLVDTQVVCEEYSVSVHLRVLGINETELDQLAEPILDVGCGKSGALVQYLREQGVEAIGIDRLATSSQHLLQADWLEFRYNLMDWGTIISHMAFSNHFIFHHLYRDGKPDIYAHKYMEMLTSLRIGGAMYYAHKYMEMLTSLRIGGEMYYAPGLPFIEQLLPAATYTIARNSLPIASTPVPLTHITLYSTKITKLA